MACMRPGLGRLQALVSEKEYSKAYKEARGQHARLVGSFLPSSIFLSYFRIMTSKASLDDKESAEVAVAPTVEAVKSISDDARIDDEEFGGTEERRRIERKLLWKLDCRMSIMIVIYILNYVRIRHLWVLHDSKSSADRPQ